MNEYLLIEDDNNKADIITQEFISLGVSRDSLKRVTSLKEALSAVSTKRYEIIILDLNIPTYKTDKYPKKDNGLIFIEKLANDRSNRYLKPNNILGLTSYIDLIKEQSEKFSAFDFSIRSIDDEQWKVALKNKITWSLDTHRESERFSKQQIIISVHGIRTLGLWQDKLETIINENMSNVIFKKYKYNYFSSLQLMLKGSREKIISDFTIKLQELIKEHPDSRIIFVAHSFGTYTLIKALERISNEYTLDISRLILISSVLNSNYDWSKIKHRHNIKTINNECGYNDIPLILSNYLISDMGMAGRTGFTGMTVINRFFKGGHAFFNRDSSFMKKYWLPLLNHDIYDTQRIDERNFGKVRENIEICLSSKSSSLLVLIVSITLSYFFYKFII